MGEMDDIRDSLDRIEIMLTIEEKIEADPTLSAARRKNLLRDIEERFLRGEFDDADLDDIDLDDDDAIGILVKKLGPRGPAGRSGAEAVRPEP